MEGSCQCSEGSRVQGERSAKLKARLFQSFLTIMMNFSHRASQQETRSLLAARPQLAQHHPVSIISSFSFVNAVCRPSIHPFQHSHYSSFFPLTKLGKKLMQFKNKKRFSRTSSHTVSSKWCLTKSILAKVGVLARVIGLNFRKSGKSVTLTNNF